MASRKKSSNVVKKRVEALNQLGEAEVARMYLDLGSIRKLVDYLPTLSPAWKLHGTDTGTIGAAAFYVWLDESDGRREWWNKVKRTKAHDHLERAVEAADNATQETAQADRLRYDANIKVAGILNKDYSPTQRTEQTTTFEVGSSLMEALRIMEQRQAAKIQGNQPKELEAEIVQVGE